MCCTQFLGARALRWPAFVGMPPAHPHPHPHPHPTHTHCLQFCWLACSHRHGHQPLTLGGSDEPQRWLCRPGRAEWCFPWTWYKRHANEPGTRHGRIAGCLPPLSTALYPSCSAWSWIFSTRRRASIGDGMPVTASPVVPPPLTKQPSCSGTHPPSPHRALLTEPTYLSVPVLAGCKCIVAHGHPSLHSVPKRRPMDETQETLRTSAFPSTHVKEKWAKNLYIAGVAYGRTVS